MTNRGNNPNCPQVIIHAPDIDENCSPGGGRVVNIHATVIGTGGTLSAQLSVPGSANPPSFETGFDTNPIQLHWVGELPAGSDVSVEVQIIEPANIPPTLTAIHIPACLPPQVTIDLIRIDDCVTSDNRNVTVHASLTGNQVITAALLIDNNVVSVATDPFTVVLAGSSPVSAGSIVPVVVNIIDPPNIPSTLFTLHVPECDEVEVEVEVPSLCPQVSINPDIGSCNEDNERSVGITASITGQLGQAIHAQLLMNGVEVDSTTNAIEIATLTGSIEVPAGGTVEVEVHITEPTNSPVTTTIINIPECDEVEVEVEVPSLCPQVSINPDIGSCNEDNERSVGITASITGQPGQAIHAQLLMDSVQVDSTTNAIETATLTGSIEVPAGGTVDVEVHITEPANCSPTTSIINIPECDEVEVEVEVPSICPLAIVNLDIGSCNENNERSVSVSSNISGQPGQAIQAKLLLNGIKVDSNANAIGTATLAGSIEVPAGGTVEVEVHIEEPANCPPTIVTINIPECDDGEVEEPSRCPGMKTSFNFGECDAQGKRELAVTSEVIGQHGQLIKAQLSFDGEIVDTKSGNSSLLLTGRDYFLGGANIPIDLTIDSPEGCGSNRINVYVPLCNAQ